MKKRLTGVLRICVAMVAGHVLSAYAQQDSALSEADPVGVYALVSVNGIPVPANISHEGNALQVRSGTFTINGDGTCSTKTVFVPPSGTEVAREVGATYTRDGSRLTMQWKGAGRTVGTIRGDTFIMNNEGMVFVYRR